MLQETDYFVQKIYAKAIIDDILPEKMKNLQPMESKLKKVQNLDNNAQQSTHK